MPGREFLYVTDAAEGIVLAAEKYDGPEPINLGTGREITIRDLAELIRSETGFEGELTWDAASARRTTAALPGHESRQRVAGLPCRNRFCGGYPRHSCLVPRSFPG